MRFLIRSPPPAPLPHPSIHRCGPQCGCSRKTRSTVPGLVVVRPSLQMYHPTTTDYTSLIGEIDIVESRGNGLKYTARCVISLSSVTLADVHVLPSCHRFVPSLHFTSPLSISLKPKQRLQLCSRRTQLGSLTIPQRRVQILLMVDRETQVLRVWIPHLCFGVDARVPVSPSPYLILLSFDR